MDELVLPLKQDRITHQVHACAAFFAVFAALGWLTATPGLVPAFDRAFHRDDFEAGSVFLVVGLGWIAAAVFGYVIYQQVRTLRYSTGLRLTSEGFQFEKHTWAWGEIDDFETVHTGGLLPTNLRVVYTPGTEPGAVAKASAALARVGLDTGWLPNYLPLTFETGVCPSSTSCVSACGFTAIPERKRPRGNQNSANWSPSTVASVNSSTSVPPMTWPTLSMNSASETTGTPISCARFTVKHSGRWRIGVIAGEGGSIGIGQRTRPGSGAQGRMAVSVIGVFFEVADHHSGFPADCSSGCG